MADAFKFRCSPAWARCLLLIAALTACVPTGYTANRTQVHLFQYGRTHQPAFQTAFLDFQDMLRDKLPRLASEVQRTGSMAIVTELALHPILGEGARLQTPDERAGSLAARRHYWTETGALSILTGKVLTKDSTPYIATTYFWGELRGPYPEEMLDITLPVTEEQFNTTDDSHSVATLYALAHEIGKDCNNRANAVRLLSEAHKRAKAVAADAPELGTRLEALVEAAIKSLKERCHA